MHVIKSNNCSIISASHLFNICLYRHLEKFLWGLRKTNIMALLSFFEYTMRRTIFKVFFLSRNASSRCKRSVSDKYLHRAPQPCSCLLKLLFDSLQKSFARPCGEDRGLATPVHDFCTIILSVGFCQYFYFLGFPIHLIVILCLWHICLFHKSKVCQILGVCCFHRVWLGEFQCLEILCCSQVIPLHWDVLLSTFPWRLLLFLADKKK